MSESDSPWEAFGVREDGYWNVDPRIYRDRPPPSLMEVLQGDIDRRERQSLFRQLTGTAGHAPLTDAEAQVVREMLINQGSRARAERQAREAYQKRNSGGTKK